MTTREAELNAGIGHSIDTNLKAQRRSRSDLADLLKIKDVTLRDKIKGRRPWTYVEVAEAADFLGVGVDALRSDPAAALGKLPRLDSNQQPAGNDGYSELLHSMDLVAA
jgi:hypothetical protein